MQPLYSPITIRGEAIDDPNLVFSFAAAVADPRELAALVADYLASAGLHSGDALSVQIWRDGVEIDEFPVGTPIRFTSLRREATRTHDEERLDDQIGEFVAGLNATVGERLRDGSAVKNAFDAAFASGALDELDEGTAAALEASRRLMAEASTLAESLVEAGVAHLILFETRLPSRNDEVDARMIHRLADFEDDSAPALRLAGTISAMFTSGEPKKDRSLAPLFAELARADAFCCARHYVIHLMRHLIAGFAGALADEYADHDQLSDAARQLAIVADGIVEIERVRESVENSRAASRIHGAGPFHHSNGVA